MLYLEEATRRQEEWLFPYPERPRIPKDGRPDEREKFVKNLQINFGPQHPAAHGVLRYVNSYPCLAVSSELTKPIDRSIFPLLGWCFSWTART